MSRLLIAPSASGDLTVIDLALNIFHFKQKYHGNELTFDCDIMLNLHWIEKLQNEISALQREHPNASIGISMEFIHSCENHGAFLHFTKDIPDPSKVFFYHILPGCDLQTRMIEDLTSSGASPVFDESSGVLFLDRKQATDGEPFVKQCEAAIISYLHFLR